jgi:hypothetical protein
MAEITKEKSEKLIDNGIRWRNTDKNNLICNSCSTCSLMMNLKQTKKEVHARKS